MALTLVVGPVQMGTQILTDAQNAIASWRRVIGVLETPADLVLEGGGVEGIALVGAVVELLRSHRVERVAGSSAGATCSNPCRGG